MSDKKTTVTWSESTYNLLHDIAFATNRKPAEVLRDAIVLEKLWLDAERRGETLCTCDRWGNVRSDIVRGEREAKR